MLYMLFSGTAILVIKIIAILQYNYNYIIITKCE